MAKGGKADGGLRSVMVQNLRRLGGHWQPIETGIVVSGVLDFNYCVNGKEGWVECKRTSGWAVSNIDGAQVGWTDQRVRNGGRVFLAVRRLGEPVRGQPYDELWLLRPSAMRLLLLKAKLNTLPAAEILGHWVGGPANWDWPAVAKALQT